MWRSGRGGLAALQAGTPMRMLLYSVRQAPGWIAVLALAFASGSAAGLLLPAAVARVVDAAVADAPAEPALIRVGLLFGAATLSELLTVWASAASGATIAMALRHGLTGRVLLAGAAGQRRFAAGDLASRMVTGASEASGLALMVLLALNSVLLSAGGLVALAVIDWTLAVAFVVCVPAAVMLMRWSVARTSELMARYQKLQGTLSALLVEALGGARTIRASGTMAREVERVLAPLPELATVGRATWDAQRRTVWRLSLLTSLTEVVVLAVAGVAVSAGRISEGQWIAVAGYVVFALGFLSVTDLLLGVARSRAGIARVAEVLSLPARPGGSREIPAGPGAIAFRSVTVRAGDAVVLDRLDLDIPPGILVAIVGRSGTGKSTLAALAGGLIAAPEGQVLLDGVPLDELRPDRLRRAVGYAFERPALLGETVHDAIAYGSAAVPRDQVERAAVRVSADGFIRRLPEGYDTKMAQAPFSGGELQRLGLARAVVGERRVLIFDDATSSLDTVTEAEVTGTLTHLLAGRTRIVVAHRAGTAARADLVVWLDDGRVRAAAPHSQLWPEPGYQALFGAASRAADRRNAPVPAAETSIDLASWLDDIRREFPQVGVLCLGPREWAAVWGRTGRLDASSATTLYGQLRGEFPSPAQRTR